MAKIASDYYSSKILKKIVSPTLFVKNAGLKKKAKQKVIFTNGCFDLLHPGHLQYLASAKSLGGQLFVAINDDHSVTALKGNSRPILTLEVRLQMLASLQFVDFVSYFSSETPLALIEQIIPDILVKGGDWSVEQIVGSEVVIKNGGQVKSLPFLMNHSTSKIIERILKLYSEE